MVADLDAVFGASLGVGEEFGELVEAFAGLVAGEAEVLERGGDVMEWGLGGFEESVGFLMVGFAEGDEFCGVLVADVVVPPVVEMDVGGVAGEADAGEERLVVPALQFSPCRRG